MWVVAVLLVLALITGGVGLIVDALQFLLAVTAVLVLLAIAAGMWLRSKAAKLVDSSEDDPR